MRNADADVLIVGSGPVGTALAIELARHGIASHVIERRNRRSPQPRAKLTNVRSMGLLRRWGLASRVRETAPLPPAFPSDVAFVTRLTGWELTRFPNAMSSAVDRSRPFPEPAQQMPQDILEDVLRARARELSPVRISPGLEFLELAQDPLGVVASVREADGGAVRTLRGRYLVGADGGRSAVRQQLGIPMPGVPLAPNVSAVLHAPDLWARHDKARAVHYWVTTPAAPGILGPLNTTDRWWLHLNETPTPDGVMTDDEVRRAFFAAVGTEFPCEVVAQGPWLAERRLADRYRDGRVLLTGDAAHLHPPMGGYGLNMGLGDAVDLGWKLAAVLQGWGGEALLDSYEAERRPIHRRVIEEAAHNYAQNSNRYGVPELEEPGPGGDAVRAQVSATVRAEKAREFATLGVQLGYRYEDSPVIVADGSAPTPDEVGTYVPTARPGHLLPHAWIDDVRCVYDLLGRGMTLLALGGDAAPFAAAAAASGVPLDVVALPGQELRELYGAPLVLVRPDQHVAWRGAEADDADRVLGAALGAQERVA